MVCPRTKTIHLDGKAQDGPEPCNEGSERFRVVAVFLVGARLTG
jgi:hypothetical protein